MEQKIKEVANAMKDINLLSSYELSKDRVLSYAEKLIQLFPLIEAKMVEDLMRDFFLNVVEYNPSKGIRNFTENLDKRNVRKESQEERARRQMIESRNSLKQY